MGCCKGIHYMDVSSAMRKPDFCLCENKGANQLCCICTADQRLCFCYSDSTISLHPNFKLLATFYICTGRFVLDLVRNPEDRFSHVVTQTGLYSHRRWLEA